MRAPRFYFTGRSGIIASNEDERLFSGKMISNCVNKKRRCRNG